MKQFKMVKRHLHAICDLAKAFKPNLLAHDMGQASKANLVRDSFYYHLMNVEGKESDTSYLLYGRIVAGYEHIPSFAQQSFYLEEEVCRGLDALLLNSLICDTVRKVDDGSVVDLSSSSTTKSHLVLGLVLYQLLDVLEGNGDFIDTINFYDGREIKFLSKEKFNENETMEFKLYIFERHGQFDILDEVHAPSAEVCRVLHISISHEMIKCSGGARGGRVLCRHEDLSLCRTRNRIKEHDERGI